MGEIKSVFCSLTLSAILLAVLSACSDAPTSANEAKFQAGIFKGTKNGYVDSPFITKDGSRIYFLYSEYSPSVFMGLTAPSSCQKGAALSGHTTSPGLEWNSDLYYVEWSGSSWSDPINLGSNVNTLGNECCVWLNDSETEIIFYRGTDLDGNGTEGDVGLTQSGNYRSTRASKSDSWGPPVALDGDYGVGNQSSSTYRHDIHKASSGNYYLWENAAGVKRLQFGRWNGTTYDPPAYITGTVHEDTQIWVSDDEMLMLYNHRNGATTDLYKMSRTSAAAAWSAPALVATSDFSDSTGNRIWGEPTLDASQAFMLFVRFDTTNSTCWSSDLMYSSGNATGGFSAPVKTSE